MPCLERGRTVATRRVMVADGVVQVSPKQQVQLGKGYRLARGGARPAPLGQWCAAALCCGNRASSAVFATIATFLTVTPAVLVVVLLAEPLLALGAAPLLVVFPIILERIGLVVAAAAGAIVLTPGRPAQCPRHRDEGPRPPALGALRRVARVCCAPLSRPPPSASVRRRRYGARVMVNRAGKSASSIAEGEAAHCKW
jgi:hypothetical protein